MKEAPHQLLRETAPPALALLLLATAPWWQLRLATAPREIDPWLGLWAALAVLGSLYAPAGRGTLGLGAAVLPLVAFAYPPAWCGAVGGGAYFVARALERTLQPGRRVAVASLAGAGAAGRIALAALVAAVVWRLEPASGQTASGALAAAVYLLLLLLLRLADRQWGGLQAALPTARILAPLALDLGGWILGLAALRVVLGVGWLPGVLLLGAVALLAAETARNVQLRRRAVERAGELWELTRASHRIFFRSPEPQEIPEQVLTECRKVIVFSWAQFELPGEGEEGKSWWTGPEGLVDPGSPEPTDAPPALPGIHRRSAWRVLDRELRVEDETVARLRLWCDPRRLEPTAVELLDALLPQVAASVHRSLLHRQATRDALTGLADRRELEGQLERVFQMSREEGRPMAVIMCDLDRFKKINDRHGHDVGDRALKRVAQVLAAHGREQDLCCRYGGEEFAVILERTDGAAAQRVAERLRIEVERAVFLHQGRRIPLRMSAGVAAFPELQAREARELLQLADEALLRAKRSGRNRSLLHLGRGRFCTADGRTESEGAPPPEPEIPTLFA